MSDQEQLGPLVKRVRGESRSVRSVARDAGVSFTYVAAIERGEVYNLTVDALSGLSRALRIPVPKLVEAAIQTRRGMKRG